MSVMCPGQHNSMTESPLNAPLISPVQIKISLYVCTAHTHTARLPNVHTHIQTLMAALIALAKRDTHSSGVRTHTHTVPHKAGHNSTQGEHKEITRHSNCVYHRIAKAQQCTVKECVSWDA